MKSLNFWRRWILTVGLILAIMGLFIAFLNHTSIFKALLGDLINQTFWINGQVDGKTLLFQKWVYGVLGATCAGFGTLIAFVAYYPYNNREKWSWNCLFFSALVWFIPDTFLSFYFDVVINGVGNIALFILLLIPLIATRKQFIVK